MAVRNYTVLVSLDGGKNWARYAEPVPAGGRQAACERVRKASPELLRDDKAEFYATPDFRPLRKQKQMVESWRWGEVEKPAQGELATDGS